MTEENNFELLQENFSFAIKHTIVKEIPKTSTLNENLTCEGCRKPFVFPQKNYWCITCQKNYHLYCHYHSKDGFH